MVILILPPRRPLSILLLHKYVPRIENLREAAFAGYFGPIGVSAIFYLYVTIEFLRQTEKLPLEESQMKGLHTMMTAARLVVWFCVIASVIVRGITVLVIKVKFLLQNSRDSSLLVMV